MISARMMLSERLCRNKAASQQHAIETHCEFFEIENVFMSGVVRLAEHESKLPGRNSHGPDEIFCKWPPERQAESPSYVLPFCWIKASHYSRRRRIACRWFHFALVAQEFLRKRRARTCAEAGSRLASTNCRV
ncbi:hypothetical protein KC343_g23 [Hortaea werneckii]|nr:hypothetical protein KC317_g24 [Hortaea werneckii]KAI7628727.1 hypothetical protein KC346_g25 [Hortaea werneckii]KAI7638505.1 hypothetical protein KC343_g23 [Hortaea werneckii]